jgi:hypothetical protein
MDFKKRELNPSHLTIAIRQAALGGQIEVLRYFLARGHLFSSDHPDWLPVYARLEQKGFFLGVILVAGCSSGNESVVRLALECGVDPTLRFQYQPKKLLNIACLGGHEHIVRILLSQPKIQDDDFQLHLDQALSSAARGGWLRIAELLIMYGAQVNSRQSYIGSPWVCAAESGHVGMLQFLLEHGAHVNYNKKTIHEVIEEAATRGYTTIVRILKVTMRTQRTAQRRLRMRKSHR